jgi:N-acetylglucosamine repressor
MSELVSPRGDKSQGATPSTLRKVNIRSVLEVMQLTGACSRAELTRKIGVSAPTMSKLLEELLARGLIEEEQRDPSGKGRPSRTYRLTQTDVQVAGAMVGVDYCRLVPAGLDSRLNMEQAVVFETPDNYADLISGFRDGLQALSRELNIKFIGLAVCIPGLVNQEAGKVMLSPNLHFLDGKFPAVDIADGFELKTVILHELQALCLAEKIAGGAKDMDDFAVIEMRHGLGMGVMSQGHFLHGKNGYAGEFGHITVVPDGKLCGCGNRGCLETVANELAFAKIISDKLGEQLDMPQAIEAIKSGRVDASQDIEQFMQYLAIGIAAVINILNPDAVFVNGQIFDLGDEVFDRLKQLVRTRALAPSSEQCNLFRSEATKAQGAVKAINDRLFESVGPALI